MAPSRRGWHSDHRDDEPHGHDDHDEQDPSGHDNGGLVSAQDWSPSAHQSSTNTYPDPVRPCSGDPSLYSGAPAYTMNVTTDYWLQEDSAQNPSDGQVLTLRGIAFVYNQNDAADFASSRPPLTFGGRSYEPLLWNPPTNGADSEESRCRTFWYNVSLTPFVSGRRKRQGDALLLNFERPSVWYSAFVTTARIEQPSPESPADPSVSSTQTPSNVPSTSAFPTSISIPSPDSGTVGQSSAAVSSSPSSHAGVIALAVIIPLLVLALAALALLVWRRRQQKRVAPSAEFRAAMAQRFPDPPMAPMESDAVSIAETDLPGYATGSSSGAVQPRGYVPGDAKRPVLGLQA